jgi:hypothetical protein
VSTFGLALEAELDSVKGKTEQAVEKKRARVLDRWLDRPLKYRNPTATRSVPGTAPASPTDDVEQEYTMRGDGMSAL